MLISCFPHVYFERNLMAKKIMSSHINIFNSCSYHTNFCLLSRVSKSILIKNIYSTQIFPIFSQFLRHWNSFEEEIFILRNKKRIKNNKKHKLLLNAWFDIYPFNFIFQLLSNVLFCVDKFNWNIQTHESCEIYLHSLKAFW